VFRQGTGQRRCDLEEADEKKRRISCKEQKGPFAVFGERRRRIRDSDVGSPSSFGTALRKKRSICRPTKGKGGTFRAKRKESGEHAEPEGIPLLWKKRLLREEG